MYLSVLLLMAVLCCDWKEEVLSFPLEVEGGAQSLLSSEGGVCLSFSLAKYKESYLQFNTNCIFTICGHEKSLYILLNV